jgi:hypothetical protein
MADDHTSPPPRPAPQYGEYATPQQQAAAMGQEYVAPAPTPAPANTLHPAATPQQGQLPEFGHLVDRFATVVQLGVGLLSVITSDWFDFATITNVALAKAGIATRVPTVIDQYGWVLLGANIVFLAATMVWAYLRLRRGRRAYYIPFVGYCAFATFAVIFSYAVSR